MDEFRFDGLYSWLVSPPLTATARIQVVSDVQPAVNDFSDGNFTIANPTIVLSSPNGGEVWEVGSSHAILWNGTGFIGNVNIELTRSWPVPSWETITANSANDGADAWAVSGPVSSSARVRVLSIGNALAGDTSAANFTVAAQSLTVVAPNGGESWTIGSPRVITWSSLGLSGNVRIDLNRIYPADAWETLFAMVPLANGAVNWAVTLPASGVARVRITSLADTSKQDISDANFTILQAPAPPTIRHDAHMDSAPGLVLFTAIVTDDAAGVTATLFHRAVGVSEFDSVALSPSGFPNEYFTSVAKSFGRCEYFVRATDVEGQPTETPIYGFMVGEPCGNQIIYDDGSAESYQWTLQDSLQWAVKFSPPVLPFAVSEAMIGVASYHPDSAHQQLRVRVFLADGPGGSPGTLVREVVRGSIGNIVGGVGAPGLKFARIMCYDELNDPYVASGDIFLSVANVLDGREAFALDTTPPHSGRSYVFDPCGEAWISEQVTDEVTRNGDRIVRMRGWGLAPPVLVVGRSGADIRLDWTRTGAPYYRVYSSTVANGVFSQFEGTAADTLFLDEGAVAMDLRLFYHVVSASQP